MSDRGANGTWRPRLGKRIRELPVLPTLLTAGNLACGVTAILLAVDNRPGWGAALIFLAMFFDLFDGKVARLTGTDGAFGAELDSLADVVSFGVAPAFLMHRLFLGEPGVWDEGKRLVLVIAVIYVVLTAIRLARYNIEAAVKTQQGPAPYFKGLPSPGAAAVICAWSGLFAYLADFSPMAIDGSHWIPSMTWRESWLSRCCDFTTFSQYYRTSLLGCGLLLAFLMVSNIPFPHLGNTLLNRQLKFRQLILGILSLGLIAFVHIYALVVLTTGYVLVFLFPGLIAVIRRWRAGKDLLEEEDEESDDPEASADADRT
jgi:CDP-diacylglycerol--serine O-phosphatidyltransferase